MYGIVQLLFKETSCKPDVPDDSAIHACHSFKTGRCKWILGYEGMGVFPGPTIGVSASVNQHE